jgi:hypothetical protein
VAKGYSQVECLDFEETFALVAKLESIHILLGYATHHDFKLYQLDVKSAFLNGPIKEEVYVEKPLGFEEQEYPNYVYKLHKALYGLSKLLEHGMNDLGIFSPKTVLRLAKPILHFSLKRLTSVYSFAKSMLMI